MIRLIQGDTKTLTFTLKTAAGAAFNLTGYTGAIMAKRNYDDADASAVISGALTISTPASGIGVYIITTAMTTYLSGLYMIDVRITLTSSGAISTVYRGELMVEDR